MDHGAIIMINLLSQNFTWQDTCNDPRLTPTKGPLLEKQWESFPS